MSVEKRSDGWYVLLGSKSEGPFKTRAVAREFLKTPPDGCAPDCPQCALEEPSSSELPWETIPKLLPTQDVKAKNSVTGKVVKMTFKQAPNQYPGMGRLFVDGRKQKGLNVGILEFKQAAERIKADILEGMVRR